MTKKRLWWEPRLIGSETVARLREDDPEIAYMTDEEILRDYGYEGHRYENTALWDHIGDARGQFEILADSWMVQREALRQLWNWMPRHVDKSGNCYVCGQLLPKSIVQLIDRTLGSVAITPEDKDS